MARGFSSHPPRDDLARWMDRVFRGCGGERLAELVNACGGQYSKTSFSRAHRGTTPGLVSRELFNSWAMGCAFVGQENGRLEAGPEARWRFIQDQHDVLVLTEQRTEDLGLFVRRGYRSRRSVSCPEFAPVACPDDLFALPTVLRRSEQAALLGEWTFARVVIPRLHGKDSEACLYAALMLLALGSPEQRVLALLDKASMWAADTSENRTKVAEIDELWNESSDDWVNRCLALRIIENRADLATRYQYHDAEAMFRDILARLDGGDWMFLSAPVQPQAPAV